MSDTVVAAIAGAILVALLGGLLAYLVNRPQTVVRRRLRRQLRRLVRVMEQPDMVQEFHRLDQRVKGTRPVLEIAFEIVAPVFLDSTLEYAEDRYGAFESELKRLYSASEDSGMFFQLELAIQDFKKVLYAYKEGKASREDAETARLDAWKALVEVTARVRSSPVHVLLLHAYRIRYQLHELGRRRGERARH